MRLQFPRFSTTLILLLGIGLIGGIPHGVASGGTETWNQHGPGSLAKLPRLPEGFALAAAAALESPDSRDRDRFVQQQKLLAGDGAANDWFGWSVALSNHGHTALIGAWFKNNERGAAYIFTEHDHTWTEQQELTISDSAAYQEFGYSVALSNDGHTALIGAPSAASASLNNGAAYIFVEHDHTWTEQQKLTASDASFGDEFGGSVALGKSGRVALIGAIGGNNSLIDANSTVGAAYIFAEHDQTWTQQQELTAADGSSGDWFGSSVALSNDAHTALISAINKNNQQGAAYIFTEHDHTWTERQELTAFGGTPGDNFGVGVALDDSGDTALIGAPGRNNYRGAAYIFTEHDRTWSERQELSAPDSPIFATFGYSVALDKDGQTALISAQITYVFTQHDGTWTQQQELAGYSVALDNDGDTALIGAAGDNAYRGGAYIFTENH